MPITSLSFTNVGPFDDITFEFNDRVNVFTGPNNSGKSTVLWILGELLVYPFGIPTRLLRSNSATWFLKIDSSAGPMSGEGGLPADIEQMRKVYDVLGYAYYIPAQRHGSNFRAQGPTVIQDVESDIEAEIELLALEFPQVFRTNMPERVRDILYRARSQDHPDPILQKRRRLMLTGPSIVSDKAVVQKMVDLDYAAYRKREPGIREIIDRVISIASEITEGYEIEFLGMGEDPGGLFPQLSTIDGVLPLDVLSQGTQSLIHWLARFLFGYAEFYEFPPDLEAMPGILIIDEIDAHLHPSWQRQIIPRLIKHFPNLQIFCSTHSPLMLAGLKEGQIQLLRRDGDNRVNVSRNEVDIVGWTADEILRNFLEVPDPTDWETAKDIERLQHLRSRESLTLEEAAELETLRHSVSEEIISGPISGQLEQFAEFLRGINTQPIYDDDSPIDS